MHVLQQQRLPQPSISTAIATLLRTVPNTIPRRIQPIAFKLFILFNMKQDDDIYTNQRKNAFVTVRLRNVFDRRKVNVIQYCT
jgi:hypothetical protein